MFLKKYVPCTLRGCKKNLFLSLEQENMSVTTYEAKLHTLSCYVTKLLGIEYERIWLFIKSLNTNLSIVYAFELCRKVL